MIRDNHTTEASVINLEKTGLWLLFVCWVCGISVFLFNAGKQNMTLFLNEPVAMEVYYERQQFETVVQQLLAQESSSGSGLATGPPPLATLIHFWNPHCHCDRFNQNHVEQLLKQYASDIRLIVVSDVKNQAAYYDIWQHPHREVKTSFVATRELSLTIPVPASPAVAVVSNETNLLYVGPYALGGFCLPNENGIVESILNRLESGQAMKYPFMNGFGCFCPWPSQDTTKRQEVI